MSNYTKEELLDMSNSKYVALVLNEKDKTYADQEIPPTFFIPRELLERLLKNDTATIELDKSNLWGVSLKILVNGV